MDDVSNLPEKKLIFGTYLTLDYASMNLIFID